MPKQIITQRKLATIKRLESKVAVLMAEVTELKAQIDQAELEVSNALKTGAIVEEGKLTAVLETAVGQCRPPWKDVYLTHMFKEHALSMVTEEARVRELYPAPTKEVLVIGQGEKTK